MRNIRFNIWVFAVLAALLGTSSSCAPSIPPESKEEQAYIMLDDEKTEFKTQPISEDGRTYYPILELVEKVGGSVYWEPGSDTVKCVLYDSTVMFTTGSIFYTVERPSEADRPFEKAMVVGPFVHDEQVFIPLRYVYEAFGFWVGWDGEHKVPVVYTNAAAVEDDAETGLSALELASLEDDVIRLVNTERAKAGLGPLIKDEIVSKAAMVRAKELETSQSHTRPDGRGCFTVLEEHKVYFLAAGENIGAGQDDAEKVVNEWMASERHRDNIMAGKFETIGVACYQNASGRLHWVQLFVGTDVIRN